MACERYYTKGVTMYFEGDDLYMKSELFKESRIIGFTIDAEKSDGGFDTIFYITLNTLDAYMNMIEDGSESRVINVQKCSNIWARI